MGLSNIMFVEMKFMLKTLNSPSGDVYCEERPMLRFNVMWKSPESALCKRER